MEYSDWLQSKHSARVWLDNAMTAQCQFATIKPIVKNKKYAGRTYKESITMGYIQTIATKIYDIYLRVKLVIEIFKESSVTSLRRVKTLLSFFGKFGGR